MEKNVLWAGAAGVVAASLMGIYYAIQQRRHDDSQQDGPTTTTTTTTTSPPTQKAVDISTPFNFSKDFSLSFDRSTGSFEGVPEEIKKAIKDAGFTEEQVKNNPSLVQDILYSLDYAQIRSSTISNPTAVSHNVHIYYNENTKQIEGIPDIVREAIQKAGFTHEQIINNPILIKDLLYSFNLEDVFHKQLEPLISGPNSFSHDFSISYNPHTGDISGVPQPILDAIKNAGYTIQQVLADPMLVKNLLYNFDYDSLKPDAPKISAPTHFSHDFSINYDAHTGEVKGVPAEILEAIKNAGYTVDQVVKNPNLVKDLLYNFDYDSLKPDAPKISSPVKVSHDFSINFNPATGEIKGVPQEILEAIKTAGYTPQQVAANPMLVKDLLYNFDYDSLKPDAPKISAPVKTTHDYSIHFNPATGEVSGVPQDILDAIKNAGYTIEQVLKDPTLVKDLLYNFDYNSFKPDAPKISSPIQTSHDFRIGFNPQTGELTGVPQQVKDAITKAGYTAEQVLANPMLVKDILYSFDYDKLKVESSSISKPVHVEHDFSIGFDPASGKFSGVPPAIEEAVIKAGYTLEQVLKNPALIKDLLYEQDYETVKQQSQVQISAPTQVTHDFSLKYDTATGKIEGIPEELRKALSEKGITEKDVLEDPTKFTDILYSFQYDKIKEKEHQSKKEH